MSIHHYHHPLSLLHGSLAGSQKIVGSLTDQALLILDSAKNSITTWHVLGITDFRIQTAKDRLSSFKLSSVICLG